MPSTPENPLADFRHCPRCGGDGLARRDARALHCRACDFLFYLNCASAVCGLVFHQDQLIVCVRGKAPGKGALDLPGGFVEFDETAEEALRREMREELNVEIEGLRYLSSAPNDYLYAGMNYKTTDLFFLAEAPDIDAIEARDDVADYLLLAPAALNPAKLAFESGRRGLRALMAHLEGAQAAAPFRQGT
jgi:ADP-ribose pyrophosphatase YjhB (NUDIX family)